MRVKLDRAAPMAAAPMIYHPDGRVAWDEMWNGFCLLASAGGPPHRGNMLHPAIIDDPSTEAYRTAGDEIIRGIHLVSGLTAMYANSGWIAVQCDNAAQAHWISAQILQENVASYDEGACFYVPVASHFTITGEIKNVITVVAKTTHYWQEHLQGEVKTLLVWETRLKRFLSLWRRPNTAPK